MKLIKFLLISTFATLLALVPVTNTLVTEATISIASDDEDFERNDTTEHDQKTRTITNRV